MRQLAMTLAVVVVVAAAAVIALFLWLRTYAPLAATRPFQPGSGLSADVEPTFGSGGKTVYIPIYRRGRVFATTFTLRNSGRFAVTVLGTEPAQPGGPTPGELVVGPGAFRGDLRLDPGDSAAASVGWRLACPQAHAEASVDRLRIRYRYLSIFTRTQTVVLPFAVTLRCPGGAPSPP